MKKPTKVLGADSWRVRVAEVEADSGKVMQFHLHLFPVQYS
jgi:hypothetical protein